MLWLVLLRWSFLFNLLSLYLFWQIFFFLLFRLHDPYVLCCFPKTKSLKIGQFSYYWWFSLNLLWKYGMPLCLLPLDCMHMLFRFWVGFGFGGYCLHNGKLQERTCFHQANLLGTYWSLCFLCSHSLRRRKKEKMSYLLKLRKMYLWTVSFNGFV